MFLTQPNILSSHPAFQNQNNLGNTHTQSLVMFRTGFSLLFAFLALLKSTRAPEPLLEMHVDEVSDITDELKEKGVQISSVQHLSTRYKEIHARYREPQKRLFLILSSCVSQEHGTATGDKSLLRPVFAGLAQDIDNEIWILSGHPMRYLQNLFAAVPQNVNFAAEWGAHLLYNNRKTEELAPKYDMALLDMLIDETIEAFGTDITINDRLQDFQRRRVVSYDTSLSNAEKVQAMLRLLEEDINNEFGKYLNLKVPILTLKHYPSEGYFTIQRRGMDKGTFALRLLKRNKPKYALSIGDSDLDEVIHKLLASQPLDTLISDTVRTLTKNSVPEDKTLAKNRLDDIADVHKFLIKLPLLQSW